jgi:hypothetical protein
MMTLKRINGFTMKEVDPQIYQISGENGNTSTFENRVRGFSDLRRFQASSEKF